MNPKPRQCWLFKYSFALLFFCWNNLMNNLYLINPRLLLDHTFSSKLGLGLGYLFFFTQMLRFLSLLSENTIIEVNWEPFEGMI
jgi:hypothetical protein